MAKTPDKVLAFLEDLHKKLKPVMEAVIIFRSKDNPFFEAVVKGGKKIFSPK